MNEIIAYKNSDGTYSDINTEGSQPVRKLTEDAQNIMRHDMAHIMAEAVISLFPKAEPTIGPFIKNGFYYDFDIERNLNEEDIVKNKDTWVFEKPENSNGPAWMLVST